MAAVKTVRTGRGRQTALNLNLRFFAVPLLYLLLLAAPLLRGLYFAADRMPFHMAAAVLFLLVYFDRLNRRDWSFVVSPIDLPVFLLAGCYLLSFFVAVDKLRAFHAVLNHATYFMLYWTAASLCREERHATQVLRVLFLSGVVVALIGLGATLGVVRFPGAVQGGRIMSTFQYPNALASYVMATGLASLGLWASEGRHLWKLLYATGNYLFIITILGTYSRGVWLVYPLGVVLLALGLRGERIWRVGFGYVWSLAACLVVLRPLFAAIAAKQTVVAARQLGLGLLIVLAGQLLYELALGFMDRVEVHRRTRRLVLAAMVVYLCIVGAVYFTYVSRAYVAPVTELLPGSVVTRAGDINVDTTSALVRLLATKDALSIVRTRPVLGAGGGGWNALYHQHQTILYWMTETHNHFAQLWVEVGTLGFLVFLGFWVALGVAGYRWWRQSESEQRPMVWPALVVAVAYGVHSLMEFQLSLPGAAVLLWVTAGVVAGLTGEGYRGPGLARRLPLPEPARRLLQAGTVVVCALLLVVVPVRLNLAGEVSTQAALLLRNHDFEGARVLYEEAARLNPYAASYPADLAYIHTVLGVFQQSEDHMERADQYMARATYLSPYDVELRQRWAELYLMRGDITRTLREREYVAALVPLDLRGHENYATSVVLSVPILVGQGALDEACTWLSSVVEIPEKLAALQAQIPARARDRFPPRRLDPSALLRLRVGQAQYLLGEWEAAVSELAAATRDSKLRTESELWTAAAKTRLGLATEAAVIMGRLGSTPTRYTLEEILLLGAVVAEANGRR
jgi:O-antigen ligase